MSDTPLADKVMEILRNNQTLGPELETDLRKLFGMPLDDLKGQALDPAQAALADHVADRLLNKLGIKHETGLTEEQELRALYPSLEALRQERAIDNKNKHEDQRTAMEALYPTMR